MARGNRSRSRRDSGEATTQVDDRGTAVEQAAAATVADDVPDAVTNAGDAMTAATATEISAARELDAQFAGQDLELSEEQQAELIPGPKADDTDTLLGIPSFDDLKNRKPDDELLGTDGDPDVPPDDPREALDASQAFNPFGTKGGAGATADSAGGGGGGNSSDTGGGNPLEADTGGGGGSAEAGTSSGSGGLGGDARDTGIFDLIKDPGADGDPLSSFLGAVEAKLGRDTGLGAPSDDTADAGPSFGQDSIAAQWDRTYDKTASGTHRGTEHIKNEDAGIEVFRTAAPGDPKDEYTAVVDKNNGTVTYVYGDGSTRTVKDGKQVDETPPLTQPDPENEGAPLPEEFQRQLDAEVARLRAAHGDPGDGVTDPVESDVEVLDPSATLQTHTELGRELFGQPDPEAQGDGGDSNFNPGADSSGAGVITPADDKDVATGPTRNDDPFADAGTTPEPVTSSNDATEDSQSFLPSETSGTAIDDAPDLPDPISDRT